MHQQTCQSLFVENSATGYFVHKWFQLQFKALKLTASCDHDLQPSQKYKLFISYAILLQEETFQQKNYFTKKSMDYFVCECNKIANLNKIFVPGQHGSFPRNVEDVTGRWQ